ncbi:Flavodoxin FAD binding domain [Trypanosoma vivax]|uniref:Putative NADPH-dependent FMN/FAD containing oxidoreductase n=1 Tax=Trypanosoma vivax (strain Y486) TaxID=1055687 RepID=G0TU76_TRYVY|nr:putative NADPH-dependent FMN/FAD containing oxidoreductase [Trypanosoma vivax]KAH8614036.1 Flavodoxin FAD binding domain [Trypanosoma vivax]CCC47510.1 putative NADPH-dependent FMN/FAD containing oxidoreductase [Trypanosoma vivax Y486]
MEGRGEDIILTVLYGTQTGSAEQLAYTLVSLAIKRGIKRCRCLPADEFPVEMWHTASPIVIVCSNANQGEAPDSIRFSWARLLDFTAPSMAGLRFAVFGTGDSIYPKFNYMAKMLHNRLRQLGGVPLVNRGLGDESDKKGYDQAFLPWAAQLWRELGLMGAGESGVIIEDLSEVPLLVRYNVEFGPVTSPKPVLGALPHRNESTFGCAVLKNERLTDRGHFQAVHHLSFSRNIVFFEGCTPLKDTLLNFEVGDALGIYCQNDTSVVERFLALIKEDGDQVVCITPNDAGPLIQQQQQPFFGRPMTLSSFLHHYVDLEAVVGRPLFVMLACFCEDDEVRDRLLELSSSESLDDFMWYCQREKRNIVEVLEDFRVVRPPLSLLLNFVPLMRPRLFSISSSPLLDSQEIHLTVAQVSWTTPYKRRRKGVCSSRLATATPGDVFQCFVWTGTMMKPETPAPLLCIGTGTGIAPLRALIRECAACSETWSNVPIVLFFGCRNREKDYIYADEWQGLKSSLKQLEVFPAFSRDGDKKFYVQHQLGKNAKRVGRLLDAGAHVFVCGNSKQMPKDVAATIEDIVLQCCCENEAQAKEYIKALQKQGRYTVDTWSV